MDKIHNRTDLLNKIYDVYLELKDKTGKNILNLSNWQVSEFYESKMHNVLEFEHSDDIIKYEYTYTLSDELLKQLRKKLMINSNQNLILASNNSIAILMIMNVLKQINCKKLCIVAPAYFSVYECLSLLNIPYDVKKTVLLDNKLLLPSFEDLMNYDYIWITSPYFCSSIYLHDEDIDKLRMLQKDGKVILVDEAYSNISCCLFSKKIFPNITLLSPSKAISINGLKFTAIIYDEMYGEIFNEWSDVIHGNLCISNIDAINFFLSSNYKKCVEEYTEFIEEALKKVKEVLFHHPDFILLENSFGNMIMIYNPKLNYDIVENLSFYSEMMAKTQGYILPGSFHDYDDVNGFCFRINLCLYEKKHFIITLNNILEYLTNLYR